MMRQNTQGESFTKSKLSDDKTDPEFDFPYDTNFVSSSRHRIKEGNFPTFHLKPTNRQKLSLSNIKNAIMKTDGEFMLKNRTRTATLAKIEVAVSKLQTRMGTVEEKKKPGNLPVTNGRMLRTSGHLGATGRACNFGIAAPLHDQDDRVEGSKLKRRRWTLKWSG